MTTATIFAGHPYWQVTICMACAALDRDRTGRAAVLLNMALRCACGGVSSRTLEELFDAAADEEREARAAAADDDEPTGVYACRGSRAE
jgi:hypothetical protein